MSVPLERLSAVLAMIRSKSVSICNRSYATRDNSGKIRFLTEISLFDALVRGESPHPVTQRHQIC